MSKNKPEELHKKTPQWFRSWRNNEFWHFRTNIENKLAQHDKLLWLVLAAIVAAIVARYVVGY